MKIIKLLLKKQNIEKKNNIYIKKKKRVKGAGKKKNLKTKEKKKKCQFKSNEYERAKGKHHTAGDT